MFSKPMFHKPRFKKISKPRFRGIVDYTSKPRFKFFLNLCLYYFCQQKKKKKCMHSQSNFSGRRSNFSRSQSNFFCRQSNFFASVIFFFFNICCIYKINMPPATAQFAQIISQKRIIFNNCILYHNHKNLNFSFAALQF